MSSTNDNSEILRRLGRLEDQDNKLSSAVQELIITSTKLSMTLEQMNKLEPRITILENELSNTKVVVSAIKWLSITVIGCAITVLTSVGIQRVISSASGG